MAVSKVDAKRLDRALTALGDIGSGLEGMQRIAFSPADVDGRRYVIDLMEQAGLQMRVDTGGNTLLMIDESFD